MASKISVVMSVYSEPQHFVKKAVDSILSQTYKDFEFIIVCDNPKNIELFQFLESIQEKDNRVKLLKNEENIGLTKSLNKAIANAEGIYIARMDADDISETNRFEEQVKFLDEHPNVGVCGSQFNYIDDKDMVIRQNLIPSEKKDFPYMIMPFFAHPAVMMRKECLMKLATPYDEHFRYAQDFSLWYRLDDVCDFYNIPKILFNYRKTAGQISAKKASEQRGLSEEIQQGYLRKKDKNITVAWDKLDYAEVDKIKSIIQSFGISDNAVKMGCKSLYRRINHNKLLSFLLILRGNKRMGYSLRDLLGIAKHIYLN